MLCQAQRSPTASKKSKIRSWRPALGRSSSIVEKMLRTGHQTAKNIHQLQHFGLKCSRTQRVSVVGYTTRLYCICTRPAQQKPPPQEELPSDPSHPSLGGTAQLLLLPLDPVPTCCFAVKTCFGNSATLVFSRDPAVNHPSPPQFYDAPVFMVVSFGFIWFIHRLGNSISCDASK